MKINTRMGMLALLLILTVSFMGCQGTPKPLEKIKFGEGITGINSAAFLVAASKGYFGDQGLEVEETNFDSGKAALSKMLSESGLNMVAVAQLPIVLNSFTRNDYAVVGIVAYSDSNTKVVSRQDSGIVKPSNLRGKKIGVTKGTNGHLFISLLLAYYGIPISDVQIVDVTSSSLPQALEAGQVDAISTWEPYASNAQTLLNGKANIIVDNSIFREDYSIVASREFITNHPKILERYLRAIDRAEKFINNNRASSIDIVARRTAMDKETVGKFWGSYKFDLVLDQSMLINLEGAARWAMENKLTNVIRVPNYLDYIYADALKAVKPEAVQITGK